MTVKNNTKDALVFTAALGIPVLAAGLNVWGSLVDILVIVPFVWLGLRRSIRQSIFSVATATLGIFLVSGSVELALSKGLLVFGVSLLFMIGISKGWKPGKIIFWASLPALAYAVYRFLQIAPGPDPFGTIRQAFAPLADPMMEQYRSAGMLQLFTSQGFTEAQVREMLVQFLQLTGTLIPSLLLILSIMQVLLSFLLTKIVLAKSLKKPIPLGPFRNWSLPWYAVWGAVLALASYLGGIYWQVPILQNVGLNLGMVYLLITIVLGIAVATYFLASPKLPLLFKLGFVFITIFFFGATCLILAVIGLFDLVMNFRKLPHVSDLGGKQ